ncbi:MAG: hypothetical protein WDO24_24390 [Pseudomonadota bacterium]
MIGETTYVGCRDMATFELDLIQVKGKTVPVRIFTLVGDETVAATPDYQALRQHHDRMLACFRAQDWVGARAAARDSETLASAFNLEGLYEVYEERIGRHGAGSAGRRLGRRLYRQDEVAYPRAPTLAERLVLELEHRLHHVERDRALAGLDVDRGCMPGVISNVVGSSPR